MQNRAEWYFLNVGKYTPNAAINGDIGWTPMVAKCWKSVLTFWCRCINMNATRMNKKIFCWSNSKSNTQCKNWHFRIGKKTDGFQVYSNINDSINKSSVLNNVLPFITQTYIDQWVVDDNRDSSRGLGGINCVHIKRLSRILKLKHIAQVYLIDLKEAQLPNLEVELLRLQSKLDAISG